MEMYPFLYIQATNYNNEIAMKINVYATFYWSFGLI